MGSFLTGATGTGNNFAAQTAQIQGQDFKGKLGGAESGIAGVNNGEEQLAGILKNIIGGGGPNPEQLQFQQNTDNAIKQNAGFIASQHGISPAIAMRLAAQNAAGMTQQAAGQSAMNGMNRQLGAIGSLQGLYGQQGNQQNQYESTLQNALASYNNANVQNTANMNNVNAGVSAQNAATSGGLAGGALKGVASLVGLYKGGEVPDMPPHMEHMATIYHPDFAKSLSAKKEQNFDTGGGVIPNWGYSPQPMNSGADMANQYIASGGNPLATGLGNLIQAGGNKALDYMAGSALASEGMADGGDVAGEVPGRAKVKGDSPQNDTVKAKLSPGEMVIPRSVMNSEDPPKAAAEFVAMQLRKKQKGSGNHSEDFHDALANAIKTRKAK